MVEVMPRPGRIALGTDKAYDTADFVAERRRPGGAPTWRRTTTLAARRSMAATTCHPGYAVSLRLCERIEEVFSWTKAVGGMRKTRHRGIALVGGHVTLTAAAYNLVRRLREGGSDLEWLARRHHHHVAAFH